MTDLPTPPPPRSQDFTIGGVKVVARESFHGEPPSIKPDEATLEIHADKSVTMKLLAAVNDHLKKNGYAFHSTAVLNKKDPPYNIRLSPMGEAEKQISFEAVCAECAGLAAAIPNADDLQKRFAAIAAEEKTARAATILAQRKGGFPGGNSPGRA